MTSQALALTNPASCRLLHRVPGRIRIYIFRLAADPAHADLLLLLVRQIDFVTEARINAPARSLVVHYAANLSGEQVFDRLQRVVQFAATLPISAPLEPAVGMDKNLSGIRWMLLATGCFAGMQAAIRFLSGTIHPFQIAFLSHLIGIAILAPWIAQPAILHTEKFPLHLLRAVIDTGATLLIFTSLSLIPLAEANAISFTAPLFVVVGAIAFLGERLQAHTWVSLVLGAIGILIILRPGLELISLGALLMLAGSATLGGVLLLIKVLAQTDSNLTINAYTVLLMTPLLLVPALLVWQVPTLIDLIWLSFVAALMVSGHTAMTQAFVDADLTTVLPVEFVQILWASGLGFLLFAEQLDLWVLVGGLIIFSGTTTTAAMQGSQSA